MSQAFIKLFGSDWRSDPNLRMCSAAARGVWIDCITLMMEAEPYGCLVINGVAMTPTQIGQLTCTPVKVVIKALEELAATGVLSRNDAGVIYSRRMVRDKVKAETDKNNGRYGGNPKLKNDPENSDRGLTPPLTPRLTQGGKPAPPTPMDIPESNSRIQYQNLRIHSSVPASARDDPSSLRVSLGAIEEARRWLPPGCDVEEVERKFFVWLLQRQWPNSIDASWIGFVKTHSKSMKP